jgi:hypothetical protein
LLPPLVSQQLEPPSINALVIKSTTLMRNGAAERLGMNQTIVKMTGNVGTRRKTKTNVEKNGERKMNSLILTRNTADECSRQNWNCLGKGRETMIQTADETYVAVKSEMSAHVGKTVKTIISRPRKFVATVTKRPEHQKSSVGIYLLLPVQWLQLSLPRLLRQTWYPETHPLMGAVVSQLLSRQGRSPHLSPPLKVFSVNLLRNFPKTRIPFVRVLLRSKRD